MMKLVLCVAVLYLKPRLRHRPRAMGAANRRKWGTRGCLSSLLDCQRLEENLMTLTVPRKCLWAGKILVYLTGSGK